MHVSQKGHSMPMMMNRPVQTVNVEGMKVTLDVMDMSMHVGMQNMKGNPLQSSFDQSKSHAIMVTVEDTASKEILSDARVNYILTSPSGAKETGRLVWSGDHFGAGFSQQEKGAYQLHLRIQSGGMERETKFEYAAGGPS